MARYISTAQRRRKTAIIAALALVLGLAAGFGLARLTTTSTEDRIASVRAQVRDTTGSLRALALHAQADVGGTSDVQPVLAHASEGLDAALTSAPWIGSTTRKSLQAELATLGTMSPTSRTFGTSLTQVADHIDMMFGVAGGS